MHQPVVGWLIEDNLFNTAVPIKESRILGCSNLQATAFPISFDSRGRSPCGEYIAQVASNRLVDFRFKVSKPWLLVWLDDFDDDDHHQHYCDSIM